MHASPGSVLLLEPDVDNRAMYELWLTSEGFHVLSATDAADAMSLTPVADVIVTAIGLPNADDVTLIETLRAHDSPLPIVVLTTGLPPVFRTRLHAARPDALLLKPCLPDKLAQQIRRLMSTRVVA